MKAVYLDLDGVMILPTDKNDGLLPTGSIIPDHRSGLLRTLLSRTKAKLVISSQRRISGDVLTIIKASGLVKYLPDDDSWKTPFLDTPRDDQSVRGQEIQAHIKKWKVKRHIILDDMPVLSSQKSVLIDPDKGLDTDHIITAIRIWNAQ